MAYIKCVGTSGGGATIIDTFRYVSLSSSSIVLSDIEKEPTSIYMVGINQTGKYQNWIYIYTEDGSASQNTAHRAPSIGGANGYWTTGVASKTYDATAKTLTLALNGINSEAFGSKFVIGISYE